MCDLDVQELAEDLDHLDTLQRMLRRAERSLGQGYTPDRAAARYELHLMVADLHVAMQVRLQRAGAQLPPPPLSESPAEFDARWEAIEQAARRRALDVEDRARVVSADQRELAEAVPA